MPRRALFWITAWVLALHWLVLQGVPMAWTPSVHPPVRHVFSTRSIAAAPAIPPAVTPKPALIPRQQPAPVRRKPVLREPEPPLSSATQPTAQPKPETAEPETTQPLAADPSSTVIAAQAAAQAALANAQMLGTDSHIDTANQPTTATASAAASAASGSASTNDIPSTAAGMDITAPFGSSAGQRASTSPPPVRIPPSVRLAFDVLGNAKRFNYTARAELVWQHDGSHYEARQEVGAFLLGSRAQRSTGDLTAQGIQPLRFSDRSRSEQAAHFDYAKGRVVFSANTPEAPIGPGAQDRLSVFIQLSALLAADPARYIPGTSISLTTVSARSADRWTFTIEGDETLDLPAGPTPALKLERLPRRDYDQKAELWLAPSLGYLPVRIKLTQSNGDFADLRLRSSGSP